MIQGQGFYLEVDIENKNSGVKISLDDTSFIEMISEETSLVVGEPEVRIKIPLLQIKANIGNSDTSFSLLKSGKTEVTVKLGQVKEETYTKKYFVTNVKMITSYGNNITVFYCLIDIFEFLNSNKQAVFKEKTSLEAIKECSDLEVKDEIEGSPDDKMNWIQCNNTDLEFISQTLKRVNLENDILLPAITYFEGVLVLRLVSHKKSSTKEPVAIITMDGDCNKDGKKIIANQIIMETNNSITDYLLSGEAPLNIIKLPYQENVSSNTSLIEGQESLFENKSPYPAMIDCSNTHPKWCEAKIANERYLSSLFRNTFYVETEGQFVPELCVLDTVEVANRMYGNPTPYGGKYILLGINTNISKGAIKQRLTLCSVKLES